MVILAAGSGTRVGAESNKVLLPLAGRAVLTWSLRAALDTPSVTTVVLVVRPGEEPAVEDAVAPYLDDEHQVLMVAGGETRHQSESAGLRALSRAVIAQEIDVIAVHDGARPIADPELYTAVLSAALEHGGALPSMPTAGLLGTSGRNLVGVQTPQAFRAEDLLAAYLRAGEAKFEGTDTAACFTEYADLPVVPVPSSSRNLKVTFAEDLVIAERLLGARVSGSDR